MKEEKENKTSKSLIIDVKSEKNNRMIELVKNYEDALTQYQVFKEKEAILKEQLRQLNFDEIIIDLSDYRKIIKIKQYKQCKKVFNMERLSKALGDDLDAYKDEKIIKCIKITIK